MNITLPAVEEDELCTSCKELRRCVVLLVNPEVYICMVCLADAMIALADR